MGKPEGKRPLEDPDVDGGIILNGSSGVGMWEHRLDRSGSG